VAPNRLERAKLAVVDLLRRLDGDRVGLVAFAGSAFLECPLTLDYAAFERTLQALHAGIIPRGGTSLSQAIDAALRSFDARQGKYQVLVLITDGEDHEGKVDEAAERAAQAGVKIFTVGIGTPDGELLPAAEGSGFLKDARGNVVKSRLDEATLARVAEKSSGAYVRGLGASLGLDEVFERHIAPMERRDVGSRLERRGEDRFQFPLAAALVLLVLEAAFPDRRRAPFWARARTLAARVTPALAWVVLAMWLRVPAAHAAADPALEGYGLYAQGDYASAAERWREALIDQPDSPLLRYNLGAALFRDARFDEAAAAFARVAATGDEQWKHRAAYNWGNALYRSGQRAEKDQPESTLKSWEQSLEAYRLAMASDPADKDAKLAYEFVSARLRALRDSLEKQKQKQEQPQSQPEQGQPPQEQRQQEDASQQSPPASGDKQAGDSQPQPQDREQGEPEKSPSQESAEHESAPDQRQAEGSQTPPDEEKADDQAGAAPKHDDAGAEQPEQGRGAEEQPDEPRADQDQQADAGGAGPRDGEPSTEREARTGSATPDDAKDAADRSSARAVLDAVRGEELGPDDVNRRIGSALVAEPREDW
jgi:Ca-activated chloride channel family protein